jgi:phosphoglycolate phosphatase-like HAD superfamily hydrolase
MRIPIFDLDGTLLDSDDALVAPFVALGVDHEKITFGHVVGEECQRLGVALDDYLDRYDTTAAQPFSGVQELVGELTLWAVCSNKHPRSGRAELARLRWNPDVALFTDAFDGPKELGPVLDALGIAAGDAVFVGDTAHDRAAARDAGVAFALAGWNPRARAAPGDVVLRVPLDVVRFAAEG